MFFRFWAAADRDTRSAAAAYGSAVTGSPRAGGPCSATSSYHSRYPLRTLFPTGRAGPPRAWRTLAEVVRRRHTRPTGASAWPAAQDGHTPRTRPRRTKSAGSRAELAQSENHSCTTQRYALLNGPHNLRPRAFPAKEQPMTDLDASASNSAGSAPAAETEIAGDPVPVLAPLAGDPAMLGLPIFIVGSVALGMVLVGAVPATAVGASLPIILAATSIGLLDRKS